MGHKVSPKFGLVLQLQIFEPFSYPAKSRPGKIGLIYSIEVELTKVCERSSNLGTWNGRPLNFLAPNLSAQCCHTKTANPQR